MTKRRVTGVSFRCYLRVYDDEHRFSPQFDDETIECDTVPVLVADGLAYGPKLLIHAVASGERARPIYSALTRRPIRRKNSELRLAPRNT